MSVGTNVTVSATITLTECDAATGNLLYLGHAFLGSTTDRPVWQIRHLTYDGAGYLASIKFANGSMAFDMKWDDRASLPYS